ncbi:glycosyltransferase family 2 protein [Thalassotalea atypica]|uniref:glycosyltransferase family 2 protein n=1 Tax=Thalassotalea atypica TaxID=2054316 RepID=UPI002573D867|nr:glycosyltransferase family 2 protein [Thalassotalea atypica]
MLVSLIVPIYNVEKYLNECLDSLVHQSDENFEVILVDDGSTDTSGDIAKQFEREHAEIFRYYYKENGGLSDARNYGLSVAKGKYVAFLDSDDYLAKGTIEVLKKQLATEAVDIICFGMREVTEVGEHIRFIHPNAKGLTGTYSVTQQEGLISSSLPNACNKLIKASLFREHNIKFPIGLWYEDLGTLPKLFFLADKITFIETPCYFYRHREGAITKTYSDKVMDIYQVLAELRAFFQNNPYSSSDIDLNTWYINLTVITLARLSLCKNFELPDYVDRKIEREILQHFRHVFDIYTRANSKKRYKIFVFLIRLRATKLVRKIIEFLVRRKAIRV